MLGHKCWGGVTCAGRADGSRRAFYKDFVKVVEAADVVIEVLDARDPLSCRCLDVERFVRRAGASKKIILLLNKIGAPSLRATAHRHPAASWPAQQLPARAQRAAAATRTTLRRYV